jgi:TrmH family RNA methyltransferase
MNPVIRLTSRDNPLLKKIRRLESGSRKGRENTVLAEGTRILQEVNRSPYPIDAVVLSERFGSSPIEKNLLCEWKTRDIRLFEVPQNLFETISGLETPQGAVALVDVPEPAFPEDPCPEALILYACGIQDPGNLGTIIRSAAAAGATLVCTSRGTVSARNPKAVRSSAGAFFSSTPVEHVAPDAFYRYCLRHSIKIYRTDTRSGLPHTDSDLKSPCAILLGNEGSGMKEKIFADLPAVRISMAKEVESLNVAVAGAVILFEASRQRARISPRTSSTASL